MGLRIELSPVKTQRAKKKNNIVLKEDFVSHLPTDGRALRALKALARSK
jgi:hypothetical protein